MDKSLLSYEVGVLCENPIKGLENVLQGENIVIAGGTGSGKTLLTFDYVAKLLENGRKVLLVADEYDYETILDKVVYAFLKQSSVGVNLLSAKEASKAKEDIFDSVPFAKLCVGDSDSLDYDNDLEGLRKAIAKEQYDAVVVDFVFYKNPSIDSKELVKRLNVISKETNTLFVSNYQTNGYHVIPDFTSLAEHTDKIYLSTYNNKKKLTVNPIDSTGKLLGKDYPLFN